MTIPKPYQTAISKIRQFKSDLIEYRDLDFNRNLTSQEQVRLAYLRTQINTSLDEIAELVRRSGVSTGIYYYPPPITGGLAGDLDLFANLFNLHNFNISKSMVIDTLDRAIGNYHLMRRRFLFRLVNPIYWVGQLIRIPFQLLSYAGFNAQKAESSIVGKLYKFIVSLATLIWSVIQILNYFEIDVKEVLSIVFGG